MLERLPAAVGRVLRNVRPGLEKIVAARKEMSGVPCSLVVTSPAFGDFDPIPRAFTADGTGGSPPIAWSGVPQIARSIVVIVEDADSPTPLPLVHAIAWSISPLVDHLPDGALAGQTDTALLGKSSNLKPAWMAPDPPPGHGIHRYAFQVFALDTRLKLVVHPGRRSLVNAMRGHVRARGLLIGTYSRKP
jgi:Raf kinase inhibitor-like YbhB/YbcL family protein